MAPCPTGGATSYARRAETHCFIASQSAGDGAPQ